MSGWLMRALLVLPCFLLAASAVSATAQPDGFIVIDGPLDRAAMLAGDAPPAMAQLSVQRVESLARTDRALRLALQLRPGSTMRVRWYPSRHTWRVSARDPHAATTLAWVEIDDRAARITDRWALPLGQYPTRSSTAAVVAAAREDERVRSRAKRWGGIDELSTLTRYEQGQWEVDLHTLDAVGRRSAEPVIRVDVQDATTAVTGVWTGIQIPWGMARGERDAFGGSINEPAVWWPLMVLFALVMVDWARLRSWWNLDVLAILGIGISYACFQRGLISWSVPTAVPPMLWLGARMSWVFARGLPEPRPAAVPVSRPVRAALRPVPTTAIVLLCVALAGLRIGVTLEGGNVIDVGHAGVAGARAELRGDAPWGNMPTDNPHGDTYGPANYLAYVPATVLLDEPAAAERWSTAVSAAQATSIAADLVAVLLLAWIGWRWISRRGAALLAAGWLACPWTALVLAAGANDTLMALVVLATFAALPRSWLRGGLIGLAALVKFAPLVVLAPMLHVGSRGRGRQVAGVLLGCGAVVAAGAAWAIWRLDSSISADLRVLWERTVGFQAERGSPFSIWGLYGWEHAQRVAQVFVIAAIALAAVLPRARDAWQVAAGSAAALIGVQLVVTHWFYLYVPWFIGLVLIVLVAARERASLCLRA